MVRAQGRELSEVCREVLEAGVANTFEVVREFEGRYGSSAIAERIAAVRPVIPIDAVARMVDAQNLIVEGLAERIREGIAAELGQSITQGEGIAKATRRLRQHLEAQDWQLERIARTEISNAMNVGHEAAIGQVAGSFPELGLRKQWSAHLDGRTSARCRSLDGDVVDHDKDFHADDGWTGPYASAHPNCRSRVVPWSDRWGGKRQRSPEEKARDEAAYQAEAAAAKAARAEARKAQRLVAKSKQPKPKKAKRPAPGAPVSAVPTPAKRGGTAVASAVVVSAVDKTSSAARRALAVIDQVHGDGVLPTIPLVVTGKKKTLGGYSFTHGGTASDIELSKHGSHPELTMAHEVGHFLDHHGIGKPGTFATTDKYGQDPYMARVMASIRGTAAHAQLDGWRGQVETIWPDATGAPARYGISTAHTAYLLRDEELWARAYAQYIATKSGDATMRTQLESIRGELSPYAARQWADDDFEPVLAAMDSLMENRGWSRSTPRP